MKKGAGTIIGIVNIIQTLPSLAILAFLFRSRVSGRFRPLWHCFLFRSADSAQHVHGHSRRQQNLLESGKGIGMTPAEQVRTVELPLAAPVIMAGIRTSTIYLIGWATLASFIGGGGLGDYIFIGLNLYQPEYIIGARCPSQYWRL